MFIASFYSDILFELAQRGGIPLTHPKAGSRRQSPSAQASNAPSKAPSRHASPPPPPQIPKGNETIAPPPAPLPPSYALLPQHHSQQSTPAISPWIDPAAVPLPEDATPLYGSNDYFSAPAQFYPGLQPMASYQIQPPPNYGVNAFGESLFGTWFQAPPAETDPRFQMPEGPGYANPHSPNIIILCLTLLLPSHILAYYNSSHLWLSNRLVTQSRSTYQNYSLTPQFSLVRSSPFQIGCMEFVPRWRGYLRRHRRYPSASYSRFHGRRQHEHECDEHDRWDFSICESATRGNFATWAPILNAFSRILSLLVSARDILERWNGVAPATTTLATPIL